jgi:hypothetical protein
MLEKNVPGEDESRGLDVWMLISYREQSTTCDGQNV